MIITRLIEILAAVLTDVLNILIYGGVPKESNGIGNAVVSLF
jgi:hypothetical protein